MKSPVQLEQQKRRYGRRAPMLLVFLLGFGLSIVNSSRVDPQLLSGNREVGNAWFETDSWTVYKNMTTSKGDQRRSNVHPLISLVTYPPVKIMRVLGVPDLTAARIFMAVGAGAYLALLFWLLRSIGLRGLDAGLFTLLAAFSTSFILFTAVLERHLFGGISVMAPLLVVALARRRTFPPATYVWVGTASFGITVTNWMVGLLANFLSFRWAKALRISIGSLALAGGLWLLHKLFHPKAMFFLDWRREDRWILDPEDGGSVERMRAFFVHSVVTPGLSFVDNMHHWSWNQVATQFSAIGSSGWMGAFAAWAWIACLAIGLVLAIKNHRHKTIYQLVLLALAGQVALHLLYGDETILYSLNWLPMLIVVASTVALSRFRIAGLVLVLAIVLLSAFNNLQQFAAAASLVNEEWGTTPLNQASEMVPADK
jgi:hypothetical protein